MSNETAKIPGAINTHEVFIEDSDETPENDIGGFGTATIQQVAIDATQQVTLDVTTRVYDSTVGAVVGTDDADFVLPCRAGKKITYSFPRGATIQNKANVATVTNLGSTAGADGPESEVSVRFSASDS